MTFRGRWSRLKVLEGRIKGASPVEIGGGRRIALSPAERYETLIDALAQEDTPTIQAIRSGTGSPGRDRYADLIQNLSLRERRPPSGDPLDPWVDPEDPADDLRVDLVSPEEFRPSE